MYHKYTAGFVDQEYNDDGECVAQEFVAGDDVSYENGFGEPVDIDGQGEEYQAFNMVQPLGPVLQAPLSNDQLASNQDIDVVIAVPLSEIVNFGFENLMYCFANNILENAILSDIQYDMVGCNPLTDMVYFHIEAFADFT